MNGLSEFLTQYKSVIIIFHALGAAIGLGAATISDVLFFHLLTDGKIDQDESPILKTLTRVIWVALGIIVLSGIGLFLSNPSFYSHSAKFIVKMFIVGILLINGLVISLYLHNKIHYISFLTKKHRRIKRIGFVSGAISIVSWYISFILGSIRSIPIETQTGILIYLAIIIGAIGISQIMYFVYKKKYSKESLLNIK